MFAVLLLCAALWIFFFAWSIGAFLYAKVFGLTVQKLGLGGISDRFVIKSHRFMGYTVEFGWGFLPFVELTFPSRTVEWKRVLHRSLAPIAQLMFVIVLYMVLVLSPKDFVKATSSLYAGEVTAEDSTSSEPVPDSVQALVDGVISEYGFVIGNLAVTAALLFVVIMIAIPVAIAFSGFVLIDTLTEKLIKRLRNRR